MCTGGCTPRTSTRPACCGGDAVLRSVWIVPALPLAGAAINLFAGKRLGRWAGVLASGVMVVAFALGLGVLADLLELPGDERLVVRQLWDWISVSNTSYR